MDALSNEIDVVWAGMLWIVCSLPIITAGAASQALYYCIVKCVRRQRATLTLSISFILQARKGRLEMRGDDVYIWNRENGEEQHWHYQREKFEAHSDDILPTMQELARCIRFNSKPLTGIQKGINSALVSYAAELSAQEKRIVYISELEQKYGISYVV